MMMRREEETKRAWLPCCLRLQPQGRRPCLGTHTPGVGLRGHGQGSAHGVFYRRRSPHQKWQAFAECVANRRDDDAVDTHPRGQHGGARSLVPCTWASRPGGGGGWSCGVGCQKGQGWSPVAAPEIARTRLPCLPLGFRRAKPHDEKQNRKGRDQSLPLSPSLVPPLSRVSSTFFFRSSSSSLPLPLPPSSHPCQKPQGEKESTHHTQETHTHTHTFPADGKKVAGRQAAGTAHKPSL